MGLDYESKKELMRKAYDFRLSKLEDKLDCFLEEFEPYVLENYEKKEVKGSKRPEDINDPYIILRNLRNKLNEIRRMEENISKKIDSLEEGEEIEEEIRVLVDGVRTLPRRIMTALKVNDEEDLEGLIQNSDLYSWLEKCNLGLEDFNPKEPTLS